MLKKKQLLALLLVAALLFAFAGCMAQQQQQQPTPDAPSTPETQAPETPAGQEGPVVVEFWTLYSPGTVQSDVYDQIVADFNASRTDIQVNITYAGQDIITKVRPSFVSKTPPDLIVSNTGLGGTLAAEGVVAPLNEYLDTMDYKGEAAWKDTFIDGALEAGCMREGNVYMIPVELAITAWFYNKAQFADLGLQVPTNWDEMTQLFQQLSDKGIAAIAADGNVDMYLGWYFTNLAIRAAGHDKFIAALNGEVSWTEPEFVEAAKKLQEMLPYFQKGFAGTQYPGANALFVQGTGAMMYVGSWIPQEIQSLMPDGFEIGMFEWPNFAETDPHMVEVKCNGLFMPVDAKNKEAAIEFAKYYTSKEVSEKIISLETHTATKGLSQPEALKDLENIVANADVVTPQYNYVYNVEYSDWAGAVLYPLNSNFMFGEIATPEEFMSQLDQGTKDYYAANPR
ncbi:extracellular solute-binding protein [Eubacteriales bacterium OttesenSCG-928-K08]|nr:extracellular solute-binding protein [Eubacteriales bacterium OttesenSCG-928-K08]